MVFIPMSGDNSFKWKQAMKDEYDSLAENDTWQLTKLPPGEKVPSIAMESSFSGKGVRTA